MAAVILITVLLLTTLVYSNRKAADFAESQNEIENFQELQKFNTPFTDLYARANIDYSGQEVAIKKGAIIEEILSVANYVNYINSNTPYTVNMEVITKIKGSTKKYVETDFLDEKKVEELVRNDLEAREDLSVVDNENENINNVKKGIRYTCELKKEDNKDTGRVTGVKVTIMKK